MVNPIEAIPAQPGLEGKVIIMKPGDATILKGQEIGTQIAFENNSSIRDVVANGPKADTPSVREIMSHYGIGRNIDTSAFADSRYLTYLTFAAASVYNIFNHYLQ